MEALSKTSLSTKVSSLLHLVDRIVIIKPNNVMSKTYLETGTVLIYDYNFRESVSVYRPAMQLARSLDKTFKKDPLKVML